ncbi:MAG: transcription termination/antitermination NusG family protein, partial [Janthinobacterium lividum]
MSEQWGPSADDAEEAFDSTQSYDAEDVQADADADVEANAEQEATTAVGDDGDSGDGSEPAEPAAAVDEADAGSDAAPVADLGGVDEDTVAVEGTVTDAVDEDAVDEDAIGQDAAQVDIADDDDVDEIEEFRKKLRRMPGEWFVIHSYAGYENRVKTNLETRMTSLNMEDYIFQVEVPMEEVVEVKNGQRKQVRRVRIPGYVLVRMDLTDESWGAVRHTP